MFKICAKYSHEKNSPSHNKLSCKLNYSLKISCKQLLAEALSNVMKNNFLSISHSVKHSNTLFVISSSECGGFILKKKNILTLQSLIVVNKMCCQTNISLLGHAVQPSTKIWLWHFFMTCFNFSLSSLWNFNTLDTIVFLDTCLTSRFKWEQFPNPCIFNKLKWQIMLNGSPYYKLTNMFVIKFPSP